MLLPSHCYWQGKEIVEESLLKNNQWNMGHQWMLRGKISALHTGVLWELHSTLGEVSGAVHVQQNASLSCMFCIGSWGGFTGCCWHQFRYEMAENCRACHELWGNWNAEGMELCFSQIFFQRSVQLYQQLCMLSWETCVVKKQFEIWGQFVIWELPLVGSRTSLAKDSTKPEC